MPIVPDAAEAASVVLVVSVLMAVAWPAAALPSACAQMGGRVEACGRRRLWAGGAPTLQGGPPRQPPCPAGCTP
jgi:hypothetical protein